MPITYSENDYFDLVTSGSEFGVTPKYKVLVEGDSWVSHPFLSNLAQQIDNLGNDDFAVLNIAEPGDTSNNMFAADSKQLKKMKQLLHNEQFGYKFDMIFISAAGNDIVGEEIEDFVDRHLSGGRTGADLINNKFDNEVKRIVKHYRNFLEVRKNSEINKKTPIICHGYTYLKPRKVGTKVFGAMFGKGWVKRYLDKKGIPQADQQIIIKTMLDRFYKAIKKLEDDYDHFLIVDIRKVLQRNGKPHVPWFHDEIHPRGRSFKKIAKVIRKEAKSKSMWPS